MAPAEIAGAAWGLLNVADSLNPYRLGPKWCRGAGRPGVGFGERGCIGLRCKSGQLLWLCPPLNFGDSGLQAGGSVSGSPWHFHSSRIQVPPPPKLPSHIVCFGCVKTGLLSGLWVWVVVENGVCAELSSTEPSPALVCMIM